jgi:transcriptional regulator with GAF, ATPase, and Fis domain
MSAVSKDGARLAELVVRSGGWIQRVRLAQQPVVFGRAADCDVQLADTRLSRHHCRVGPDGAGGWFVEDLGSQAGTLLDGQKIGGALPLRPGEILNIGPIEAVLDMRPATPSVLVGDPSRDTRNVGLLLQTIEELYGSDSPSELLRTIVDRAILLAGGDRGALLLAGGSEALEVAVAREAGEKDLPADGILTRGLAERALLTQQTVALTDAEAPGQREQVTQSVFQRELRTVLCVPLPGRSRPLGVLYVDGRRPADAFGPAEQSVLEALAVHGALAIERAELRESQLRQEREARLLAEQENAALRARLDATEPIGESAPMRHVLETLRRVAASAATVCLLGETGTGKEVLARYLHRLSPRAGKPFVAIDCGAIPESLIESELFGHEKGAFTGATSARPGLFREAEGGTVFLDEIAELPLGLQTRLLRVLQERSVQPVGGSGRVPIDVRIVCATHRDLAGRVAEGQFREDLYYRIAVLPIAVPPLRERGEDVLLLARSFLNRYARMHASEVTGFTREALEALLAHPWPGNVRELENCIQRSVLLARPPYATARDLGLDGKASAAPTGPAEAELPFPPLQDARAKASERFERTYVEEALQRANGSVAQAAALAGVSRQMLWRLVRRHGVDRQSFATEE